MNESDARIRELLKSSLPPVGDAELEKDLWPEMLQRIADEEGRRIRFVPLDWAIAGLVAASVFIFPTLVPGLLYHL